MVFEEVYKWPRVPLCLNSILMKNGVVGKQYYEQARDKN